MSGAAYNIDVGPGVALMDRELVRGECSCYPCVPAKSLLRPGEAVQGAPDAGATAQVDVGRRATRRPAK